MSDEKELPEGYEIKTEMVEHNLEELFNIENGSTEIVKKELHTAIVVHEEFDEKDQEIEKQIQTIYDRAMTILEDQEDACVDIEPKYIARNNEVKNMLLNTALNALSSKINLKKHKDNLSIAKANATNNKTVNNQNIFIDRNTLLKAMLENNKEEKVINKKEDEK